MTLDLSYGRVGRSDDGVDALGRPRWFVEIDGRRWPIEDLGHRFHPQVRSWNAMSVDQIDGVLRHSAASCSRSQRWNMPTEERIRMAILEACFHLRVAFVARFERVVTDGLGAPEGSAARSLARDRQTILKVLRAAFGLVARSPGAPRGARAA